MQLNLFPQPITFTRFIPEEPLMEELRAMDEDDLFDIHNTWETNEGYLCLFHGKYRQDDVALFAVPDPHVLLAFAEHWIPDPEESEIKVTARLDDARKTFGKALRVLSKVSPGLRRKENALHEWFRLDINTAVSTLSREPLAL